MDITDAGGLSGYDSAEDINTSDEEDAVPVAADAELDNVHLEKLTANPQIAAANAGQPIPKTFVEAWIPIIVLIEPRETKAFLDFWSRLTSFGPGSFWRPSKSLLVRYIKAAIALLGQVLLWVGAWDLLSCEARSLDDDDGCDWSLTGSDGTSVNIAYTIIGIIIVCIADTYYANANMDTPLNPREDVFPIKWWITGIWPLKYDWSDPAPRERLLRGFYLFLRMTLAFLGLMVLWVGAYNLVDDDIAGYSGALMWSLLEQPCESDFGRSWCIEKGCSISDIPWECGSVNTSMDDCENPPHLEQACNDAIDKSNVLTLFFGIVLLYLTRSVYCMAMVFPPEIPNTRKFKHISYMNLDWSWNLVGHFYLNFLPNQGRRCLEAFVSILAQNMFWVGTYNLVLYGNYGIGEDKPIPHIIILVFTFIGMCVTDSFVAASFIELDQPRFRLLPGIHLSCLVSKGNINFDTSNAQSDVEQANRPKTARRTRSFVFIIRVFTALFANVLFWNASWVLVEFYITENVVERNIVYVLLGVWLLYMSDALYGTCGVYPARSVVAAKTELTLNDALTLDNDA